MNARFYLTLCLTSLLNASLMAQITVNTPVSRMVFQRSADNSALVPVRGNVSGQVTRVKGRLVARQGGQTTDWREGTVQNGTFQLNVPAVGGFYDLELIALSGNTEIARQNRERIGVGEVFVVSGQSNNFGEPGLGLPATDDRVSVVNHRQGNANEFDPNALPMAFAQAGPGTACGPLNPLYIWGGLGDRLVARLGVPVLFLGAAHQGSSTKNWREAAQGMDRVSGRDWYNNVPYRPFCITLQQYAGQTGVRGVLWHQGESDNSYITADGYADNLRILIDKARQDSQYGNLSWVIARTSYYPYYPGHERDQSVIDGQNRVINSVANCFPGPSTDDFTGTTYRHDLLHFAPSSYGFLADLWNQSLTTDYFQRSQPSLPSVGQASPVVGSDNVSSTPQTGSTPPVASGSLQLGTPDYTCQTGAITFRLVSNDGSGNPVEFMAPGVTGWTTNPSHVVDAGVRQDAQTLTLWARQSGQQTSLVWNLRSACNGSITPPAPTPQPTTPQPATQTPKPQPTGGGLALMNPIYNCQTGAITFVSTGGNGSPVEFMAPGITGWTTNPSHTVEAGVRQDAQTLTLWVRQSGQQTSLVWNLRSACDGSAPVQTPTPQPVVNVPSTPNPNPAPPAPTPPASGGGFALVDPAYDCQTGTMVLRTTGGNGNLVEFMAPGVTDWTTNPTHVLNPGVRRDAQTITIWARQSGIQTSMVWNLRGACSGVGVARVAQLSSPDRHLMAIPNPTTEQVQLIWPEITRMNWKSRFVSVSGNEMPVTVEANQDGLRANIRHLTTGVYLWQVIVQGGPPLTFRVMKVE